MITETYSVDSPVQLEVRASSGSVAIEPSDKTVYVEIDTRQPDSWRVSRTGSHVSVRFERGLIDRGGRARIRIGLPAGSSADIHTASADVHITTPVDRLSVITASGEIRFDRANDASLKTASGDVLIEEVQGDLDIRSVSGDVRVSRVGGRLGMTTVSGDVHAGILEGGTDISTTSGDVHIDRYTGTDLETATVSGDVSLGLPAGRTVRLQAKTLSGRVRLPERRRSSSGGPEVDIRMRSVSGDLRIQRLG